MTKKPPAYTLHDALSNADARALYRRMEAWLEKTDTRWQHLAAAAGLSASIRSVVLVQGKGMRLKTHDALVRAMEANPDGIPAPSAPVRMLMSESDTAKAASEIRDYLNRTETHPSRLAAAIGVPTASLHRVLREAKRLSANTAAQYRRAMEKHPEGMGSTPVNGSANDNLGEGEIQRRRDEVRREREQRALSHLQAEKAGINGKRAGSMRPVWEMLA
jgi:hypothetical protein